MVKKRYLKLSGMWLIVVFILSSQASEAKDIELGIFNLRPSLRIEEQYDDNIRLVKDGKKSDWITTINPTLEVELPLRDNRLLLVYSPSILRFKDAAEENSVNQLLDATAELNFTDLKLSFSERYERITNRLVSETSARAKLSQNTSNILAVFDRPNWGLETGWTHKLYDYRTTEFNNNDYDEDIFAFTGLYKILPKTSLLLEFDYGLVNYDRNVSRADSEYLQFLAGLRGNLTAKILATVKAGYQSRDYEEITGAGGSDFSGFVTNADLTFAMTPDDILRLALERSVNPSTFGTNNYFESGYVSLGFEHRFWREFRFLPSASYQLIDYQESSTVDGETKERGDDFFSATLGLDYQPKDWLNTGIEYGFRKRDSNFNTYDYNDNRVSVYVTASF